MAFAFSFVRRDEDVAEATRVLTGASVRAWVHWLMLAATVAGTLAAYAAVTALLPNFGIWGGVAAAVLAYIGLGVVRQRLGPLAQTAFGRRIDAHLDDQAMRETQVDADETGVRMASGGQHVAFEWRAFSGVIDARDAVVLVAGGVGHVIPTRAFESTEAKAAFVAFVRAQAPNIAD